ncbi:MAG TPA: hypothetical protein VGU20_20825 [Stellaceae bacterium]|nr:hypothetical protein [Stellaceae bacterium]
MPTKAWLALISAASLTVLVGCVSPEELQAQDAATCASYGFQQTTPEFATCLQRENLARQSYWANPGLYGPGFYSPYGYGGSGSISFGF